MQSRCPTSSLPLQHHRADLSPLSRLVASTSHAVARYIGSPACEIVWRRALWGWALSLFGSDAVRALVHNIDCLAVTRALPPLQLLRVTHLEIDFAGFPLTGAQPMPIHNPTLGEEDLQMRLLGSCLGANNHLHTLRLRASLDGDFPLSLPHHISADGPWLWPPAVITRLELNGRLVHYRDLQKSVGAYPSRCPFHAPSPTFPGRPPLAI